MWFLGQAISMVLPEVIGYKITGTLNQLVTSTDVVLTITKHLRQVRFTSFFDLFPNSMSVLLKLLSNESNVFKLILSI